MTDRTNREGSIVVIKQSLRRKRRKHRLQEGKHHQKKERKELKKLIKAASHHVATQKRHKDVTRIDVINTIINDNERVQIMDDKMPIPFELVRSLPARRVVEGVYLVPKLKRLAVAEPHGPYRVVAIKFLIRSPLWTESGTSIIEALQQLAR